MLISLNKRSHNPHNLKEVVYFGTHYLLTN